MPVTFQSAGAFTASDQAAINRGFTQINADYFVDGDIPPNPEDSGNRDDAGMEAKGRLVRVDTE